MADVVFERLPEPWHEHPHLRAWVGGLQVVWKTTFGWRCRCGKTTATKRCRHVRAVVRELPDPVFDQLDAWCQPRGWSVL